MKKFVLIGILVISYMAHGQSPMTESKEGKQNSAIYFDYYRDFQNYATNKSCKYRDLYDKYTKIDSLPIYYKMTKKPDEYPSPCYEIVGDGTVRTGMSYHYTFLLQMFYKRLSCLKDGSKIDPDFMKYEAYDSFRHETTREAIELLGLYENNRIGDDELDVLFERAKTYFKQGLYIHSNAIFAFLATVDESYREACINNVGLSFYHEKAYRKALDYFEYAITLYPEGYLGYLNAGAAKSYLPVDLGDQNQSIYYFKKAYELAPDNPNVINNYKNAMKGVLQQLQ